MSDLQIKNYLEYCQCQKRLDKKTLKAYRIDLEQFRTKVKTGSITDITADTLEDFIVELHQEYNPKTVKRKTASVKALFHHLEYKDAITQNSFNKMHVKLRDPAILPKTIPLHTVEQFLSAIYTRPSEAKTDCQKKNTLRDIAVIELLFNRNEDFRIIFLKRWAM